MIGRTVFVLYGSQTGNSESMAKDVSEKLANEGVETTCSDLNSMKGTNLRELASFLIIVCSTTGNGDAPENANDWWRSVKLRSLAKDMFSGVPYSVLGLGDTNYDKYCYMGKQIDKRLSELGAKRIVDMTCADEGTGLEETVEAWKKVVISAVKKLRAEESSTKTDDEMTPDDEEKLGEEHGKSGESPFPHSCSDASLRSTTSEDHNVQATMPAGILSLQEIAGLFGLADKLAVAPAATQLPKAKACPENKCPYQIIPVDARDPTTGMVPSSDAQAVAKVPLRTRTPSEGHPESPWTAETPFLATVDDAKWLTSTSPEAEVGDWGEGRSVIHLELSIAGSNIVYSPGDSIGICCPNAPYAVEVVLRRLQTAHPEAQLERDTLVKCAADGSLISLEELLSYKFDLMGPPRKAALMTLASCCVDPAESILLQHLCSKGEPGKTLWDKFVETQRLGLAELLALVPSCAPKLHQLLSCLTPLPPRYYSISSSQLRSSSRVSIAFSIVRYTCQVSGPADSPQPAPILRAGLCTTYLEHILRPLLNTKKTCNALPSPEIKLRVFPKVSINFHLPGSVAPPLILIGPGTGVAPFMGFLEHRAQLAFAGRRSSSEGCCMGMWRGGFELEEADLPAECGGVEEFIQAVEPGPVHLFFGCRNECDYLFKSELQEHLFTRTLSELDVAMSRAGPEKVYVTHKLHSRAGEIARLVLEDGAHIYVCGDGNQMAKDVYCAIKAILANYTGLSDEETENMLQDLKLRRRYVLDIWS